MTTPVAQLRNCALNGFFSIYLTIILIIIIYNLLLLFIYNLIIINKIKQIIILFIIP